MSATGEHTSQKSVDLYTSLSDNRHMNETNKTIYTVDGSEYKKDKSFSWNMFLSIAFGLGEGFMSALLGLFD